MYKKFSLEEVSHIQNNFIPHLYKIIQQEKFQGVNDFFKFAFKEGEEVFFFERGNVCFKIALVDGKTIHMMDEVDKIEVEVPFDHKGGLQDLVKKYIIKKQRQV
jgi:SpoU rRNA methylase family enzyme